MQTYSQGTPNKEMAPALQKPWLSSVTLLSSAEAVSSLGHWMIYIYLPTLLIFKEQGGIQEQSLIFLIAILTRLLCSPLWGNILDKINPKKALILGYLLSALVLFAFQFTHHIYTIYGLIALWSALSSWNRIAQTAAITALASPENFLKVNALIKQTSSAINIVNPILSGSLIVFVGFPIAVTFNAILFLIIGTSLGLLAIRKNYLTQQPEVSEPLQAVITTRPFVCLFSMKMLAMFIVTMMDVLTPIFVRDEIQQTPLFYSSAITFYCTGVFLGATLIRIFRHKITSSAMVVWISLVLMNLLPLSFWAVPAIREVSFMDFIFLFGVLLSGIGSGIIDVVSITLLQKLSPPAMLGRISGAFWVISEASQLIMIMLLNLIGSYHLNLRSFNLAWAFFMVVFATAVSLGLRQLNRRLPHAN